MAAEETESAPIEKSVIETSRLDRSKDTGLVAHKNRSISEIILQSVGVKRDTEETKEQHQEQSN